KAQCEQNRDAAAEEAKIEPGVGREQDGKRSNQRKSREGRDAVRPAAMARGRRNQIAEQAGGRDFPRSRQRKNGEAQRRQRPEGGGKHERSGIDRVMRRRGNLIAEEMLDGEG